MYSEISEWHQYLAEQNMSESEKSEFKKFVEGKFEVEAILKKCHNYIILMLKADRILNI